ncbi:asparagine---tRNA ligase [Synchytrium microbalum]|uniref:Asparagine--tRNA ligase, mitochondrial n=1 Tax=Synchytrium microbalum TaxID=1806994 RepID=A0A507BTF9_9FUNG|nr:asparagine---tRNA ligase [Synchytrium microbalum]TPX30628.1 asparagine---tRNA ligase [Synchytrium microbalum]
MHRFIPVCKAGLGHIRHHSTTSGLPSKTIKQLLDLANIGERVDAFGWIHSARSQSAVAFAEIVDGSTERGIQAVMLPEQAKHLTTGCCVHITGIIASSPAKGQSIELKVEQVKMLGEAPPNEYPLSKTKLSLEYLREHINFRSRTKTLNAVWRIRDAVTIAIQEAFKELQFLSINSPLITSNDCEGAGETFTVSSDSISADGVKTEFFRKPVYLTVSGQLHAELMASALSRVYVLGPTFRAEKSDTTRHLAEFWMLEAEASFLFDIPGLVDLVETVIKNVTRRVLSTVSDDIAFVRSQCKAAPIAELEALIDKPFTRITYTEAIKLLTAQPKASFKYPVSWGVPLQTEHEQWLARDMGGPVFVTDYPAKVKSFYMRVNDTDADSEAMTVACTDLLVPVVGELVGGSLREERLDVLISRMKACGVDEAALEWYIDLRRFGSAPHGGFGMGIERYLLWITGMSHVRDLIPVPRWYGHCQY